MEQQENSPTNNNNAVNPDNGAIFTHQADLPSALEYVKVPKPVTDSEFVKQPKSVSKADRAAKERKETEKEVTDFCNLQENAQALQNMEKLQKGSARMRILFCLSYGRFVCKLKESIKHGGYGAALSDAMASRGIRLSQRTIHTYRKAYENAIKAAPSLDGILDDAMAEIGGKETVSGLSEGLTQKVDIFLQGPSLKIPYINDYRGEALAKSEKSATTAWTPKVARQALNRHISSSLGKIVSDKTMQPELKKAFGQTIHTRNDIPVSETIKKLKQLIEILEKLEAANNPKAK